MSVLTNSGNSPKIKLPDVEERPAAFLSGEASSVARPASLHFNQAGLRAPALAAASAVQARPVAFIFIFAISILIALLPPTGGEDFKVFYNAGLAARSGENPYSSLGFLSPLHVLILCIPLSLFRFDIAVHLMAFITALIGSIVFYRLSRRIGYVALAFLSPFILQTVFFGNIEFLTILATIVNPTPALFLALAKPQLGFMIAIMIGLDLFKSSRRWFITICLFAAILFAVSFAAGMNWSTVAGKQWNISIWPYGLPLGIGLVYLSIRRRDRALALFSASFLSPYLSPTAPVTWLPFSLRNKWLLLATIVVQWIIFFALRIILPAG